MRNIVLKLIQNGYKGGFDLEPKTTETSLPDHKQYFFLFNGQCF